MQQRVFERPIIGPEGWIGVVDLLIAFCYERVGPFSPHHIHC